MPLARACRQQGKTVGVLAVDPTSRVTGGAILGDRIRMQRHYADPGIFIRSMATRGTLGGLAARHRRPGRAAGCRRPRHVMVETVGVGQDEIDIAAPGPVTVVVLVPGMGDDVQAIKAGIMEIADIFVINKSDRDGAERVEREIRAMQTLAIRKDNWTPPIVKTVGSDGTGIAELLDAISGEYREYAQQDDRAQARRIENWRIRLATMLREALFQRVLSDYLNDGEAIRYAAQVAAHERDPYSLVEEIVGELGRARELYRSSRRRREVAIGGQKVHQALGLEVMPEETVEAEQVRAAMVPVGESRIELLEPTSPDSTIARFLEKRGPGLHHVALHVNDLSGTVERLKAAGTRLVSDDIKIGAGGHLYVFVHPSSTGGVLLELVEDAPEGV